MKKILALLALLLVVNQAAAQVLSPIGPNPTSVGTAAVGQIPGTTTNDNASTGNVGEYLSASSFLATATVTVTIATPAVVSWTAHGLVLGSPVVFTTTGALPTGITAGTTYWVIPVDANSFNIATSVANAIAGTKVATSGSQSGTQTGASSIGLTTNTATNLAFLTLPAGDYDISGSLVLDGAASTTVSFVRSGVSATSATLPTSLVTDGFTYLAMAYTGTQPDIVVPIGPSRKSLSTTTTIYLQVSATFAVSTLSGYGTIRARRVR